MNEMTNISITQVKFKTKSVTLVCNDEAATIAGNTAES